MRCLALADFLRAGGADTLFVASQLPETLAARIRQGGHELRLVEGGQDREPEKGRLAHSHWLAGSQIEDARATTSAIARLDIDWLIVDHYGLDAQWESLVRPATRHLLAIDDLADRRHACDVLLDQNYYGDAALRYRNLVQPETKLLLGPSFALLRPEFRSARPKHPREDSGVSRVCICFGGADVPGLSENAARAVAAADVNVKIDIVIGPMSARNNGLHTLSERIPNVEMHVSPANVAALLARADIGIGGAGSMSWERACVGLPSLIVVLAENQRHIAEDLHVLGAAELLGDARVVTIAEFRQGFERLVADGPRRRAMSMTAMNLVDGLGCDRIAAAMKEVT